MPNTVRDWMSIPVVVIDADSNVKYALTLMRRRKIHSLVVATSDKNPTYGIVTTTDIRDKIVAAGRDPSETTVGEIMSGPLVTGNPDWTLIECSQLMQEKRIHHLPIADESGALIGLISATDIFMAVEETGWQEKEESAEAGFPAAAFSTLPKQKYYVGWKVWKTGIFASWAECAKQVKGFVGAEFKSFDTLEEAEAAYR